MYATYKLARYYFVLLFVVLVSIPSLTSCVSGPLPPPKVISPKLSPPPLPPAPPYESYRGEAEKVQKVLDSIGKNQHNDAPRFVRLEYSLPYPLQPRYPANITISNETKCELGFYLGGPIFREFGLKAGKSVSLDIVAGTYLYGIDTHLCTGNIPPQFGKDLFEAGNRYSWTLSREDIEPKLGSFIIDNRTGDPLTVSVGEVIRKAPPGLTTIELLEGSYTAKISTRCGSKTVNLEIKKGVRHEGQYSCMVYQIPR